MAVKVANNISLLIYDNPNDSPRRINNPVLSVFDSSNELIQKGTVFTVKLSAFVENPPTTTQGIRDAAESRFNEYQRIILGNISNEYPYEIAAFFGFYNKVQPLFATSKYLNDVEFTNPALTAHQDPGYTTLNFTFAFSNNAINLLMCPRSNFSSSESDNYPVPLLSIDSGFEILDSNVISIVADPTIWTRKNRGLVLSPKVQKIYSRYQNTSELIPLYDYSYSSDSLTDGQIAYNAAFGWYFTENSSINRATVLYSAVIDGSEYNTEVTIVLESDEPYSPGGNSGPGGGGGNYGKDESSDNISGDIPNGSTEIGIGAYSLYTRFLPTIAQLKEFASWLWSTDFLTALNKELYELFYGDISDAIISLMTYPFAIDKLSGVNTSMGNISLAGSSKYFPSAVLNNNFATIDWGTLNIQEYWGNFLDYAPHTKIELYLPWCTGTVPIDPNECMNGYLRVVTNIELDKGTCLHNVTNHNGSVLGSYTGVCARPLPITSRDTAGKALALVTAGVATIAAGVAGGAASSAASGAAIEYGKYHSIDWSGAMRGTPGYVGRDAYKAGIARAEAMSSAPAKSIQKHAGRVASVSALAAARIPPAVQRNGSFNGTSAGLGVQYPYVIISRPDQSVPEEYGHHYGYPSNIYAQLRSLKGYTEIGEIHLTGIAGTAEEISELDRILKEGVIF